MDTAKEILHKHRIEKLLIVDDHYMLKGMITVKDIMKKIQYPDASKDDRGRLRVAAAIVNESLTMPVWRHNRRSTRRWSAACSMPGIAV